MGVGSDRSIFHPPLIKCFIIISGRHVHAACQADAQEASGLGRSSRGKRGILLSALMRGGMNVGGAKGRFKSPGNAVTLPHPVRDFEGKGRALHASGRANEVP